MATAGAAQQIKSIRIYRQIIRADGTREPEQFTGYIDRDPAEMERVICEEKPDGRITSGQAVIDILNTVSEHDAQRICQINQEISCE